MQLVATASSKLGRQLTEQFDGMDNTRLSHAEVAIPNFYR